MPPPILFRMKAKDHKTIRLTVVDDETDLPLNLAGIQSITWQAAPRLSVPVQPTITKSLGAGVTVISPPENGMFDVELLPTDTESYRGEFVFETEVVDAAGKRSTMRYKDEEGNLLEEWHYGLFYVEPQWVP